MKIFAENGYLKIVQMPCGTNVCKKLQFSYKGLFYKKSTGFWGQSGVKWYVVEEYSEKG